MAYRRPAVEVIQEFQSSAAALALPTLPACVVGPGFEIKDDAEVGVYDGAETLYGYTGSGAGVTIDLTDAPDETDEANVHKGVGVKLQNLYLQKVPVSGSNPATGVVDDDAASIKNIFSDATASAFASFDPDATGAPTFYVDVVSGAGLNAADLGRKLITEKIDDNTLRVAAEWQSSVPVSSVTYRILEFRDEEIYPEDSFADNDITKAADGVTIGANLRSVTDGTPLLVDEADVLLSWRGLKTSLANALTVFTDTDSLKAVFGVDGIVPSNIGAFAVNIALQNTTTEVSFSGLNADYFDNEELAYTSALEYLESKDVYALAILTQNTAVHQLVLSHVEGMSQSTVGRERVAFINRELTTIEVITPASGLGNATGGALTGSAFLTFRDTDATLITDDVSAGHFLEVVDYVAAPVAPVITQAGTPGAAAATYRVVAVDEDGNETAQSAAGATSTGNATLNGTNYNIVDWTAVPGAASYKVYRTVGGPSQGLIQTVSAPTTILNDTGLAGDSSSPPTTGHLPAEYDAFLRDTRHEVDSVDSQLQVSLATNPTGGVTSAAVTLTTITYRLTRDLTRTEEAELIAGYSTSLGSRRIVATWPDTVAVSVNAQAVPVPGYFVGAALAGMTAGLPSQAGFTNLSLTGFIGRENSDDRYTDTQLDTIAGGGTLILTQPVVGAALSVRHQLTTDVSTIYFQEFSVTKNVDLIARFFRTLFKPFLGIYNITDGLLDLLKTRGEGGCTFLKNQRVGRVGAPVRRASLTSIKESTDQPDSVEIDVDIDVPLPLNNVKLRLLV